MSGLPLSGVRVLAVEQYGAGPFGTMLLADLGAEIVKIENPADGGDVGRHVGPHFVSEGDSLFFQAFNRNKRSLTLNLKHPDGRTALHALARTADAVFDNLRGDQPEKLGLTYDALSEVNPKLVCAHLSAYGRSGSRKSWPGYDYLMQAEAGYLRLTGEPDGPPSRMGLSIVDMMTGLMAAFAMLAAITSARETGRGRDVDVSLFDTALHNLSYVGAWYLNGGHRTARVARSGHPSLTPSQLFKTKDGWLFIMCNKEKFWGTLAERLGRPKWRDDPQLRDFKARLANRARVTELLDDALQARTTEEWLEVFAGTVPVAPVYDVAQALEAAFVAEQARVAAFAYPDGSSLRAVASPLRLGDAEVPRRAAPALGADTDALLREVGYGDEKIARLRKVGAI